MLNEDKLRDDQTPKDEARIAATLKQAQRLAHGKGDSKFRQMARDRAVMLRRAQKKGGVHINSSYEPQGTMLEKLDMLSKFGKRVARGVDVASRAATSSVEKAGEKITNLPPMRAYGQFKGKMENNPIVSGSLKQAAGRLGKIAKRAGETVLGKLTLLPTTAKNPIGDTPRRRLERAQNYRSMGGRGKLPVPSNDASNDVQEIALPGSGEPKRTDDSGFVGNLPTVATMKKAAGEKFKSMGSMAKPFRTPVIPGMKGALAKKAVRAAQTIGAVARNIGVPKSERGDTPAGRLRILQNMRAAKQDNIANMMNTLGNMHHSASLTAPRKQSDAHFSNEMDAFKSALDATGKAIDIKTGKPPKFGRGR